MMAEHLKDLRLQVLTNSFVIADYLFKNSKCGVSVPAGKIYRDQNLILSPFHEDGTSSFYADKLFLGAQGIGAIGVMETDPQVVQASSRLLKQAERRVLLIDSTKFQQRSSIILCALGNIDVVVTDAGVDEPSREMLNEHGCKLIIADEMTAK
jgi:DeoR family ulaG and ulaABCDEF operon transcriptional repressor